LDMVLGSGSERMEGVPCPDFTGLASLVFKTNAFLKQF
jgi:hypothetical protein